MPPDHGQPMEFSVRRWIEQQLAEYYRFIVFPNLCSSCHWLFVKRLFPTLNSSGEIYKSIFARLSTGAQKRHIRNSFWSLDLDKEVLEREIYYDNFNNTRFCSIDGNYLLYAQIRFDAYKIIDYTPKLTTQIYDRNGELVANLFDEEKQNLCWV